jgi:hypothetical protein
MLGQPVLRQVVGAALMLGLAGALAPAHAKTRITREGGKVVLENEFLKARIDPLRGARLESLVVRQERESVELVAGPSVIESVVLPNDKLLSLADMEFKEVPVGEKEDAQCVLEAALPKGEPLGRPASEVAVPYFPDVDYSHVKLEKRYVLGDGEARLRVLYRLTNAGAKPVTICLAFQQQFADPRGKRSRFFVPGAGGVTALPDRGAQRTFYDLAEGWVGVLSDVGLGTIRWFDPRYLSCIRVTGDGSRRTEMVSTEMDVAAGKSWEVESVVMPLVGMTGIQAGGRDFAAEITLPAPGAGAPPKAAPAKGPPSLPAAPPPGAVYSVRERLVGQLSFLPSQAMRVGLTLTARRLPAGKETRLSGRTNLPLQAG